MPEGRHGLFRFGAFVAARGHRPSIMFGYRPPNISHAYNAKPCTKFRFSQLASLRRLLPYLGVQVPY